MIYELSDVYLIVKRLVTSRLKARQSPKRKTCLKFLRNNLPVNCKKQNFMVCYLYSLVSKIGTDFTMQTPAEPMELSVIFEMAMDYAAIQKD
jgi:hypothetical protein